MGGSLSLKVIALALMLSSCSVDHHESNRSVTTSCAAFSFRVSGRSEIIQARKDFYEAAILIRRGFSDTSYTSSGLELAPWSYTHAEIKINYGKIVLGGHSDYPDKPDPASDMSVSLFDSHDPSKTKPCDKFSMDLYEQVKKVIGQRWKVVDSANYPRQL